MNNKALFFVLFSLTALHVWSREPIIYIEDNTPKSEYYTLVTIGKKSVRPQQFRDISYVHFSISSGSDIQVNCVEDINEFEISPLIKKIDGHLNGKSLRFRIPNPGYYVIRINGGQYLFLLADSPQEEIYSSKSSNIVNVEDFLPKGNPNLLLTKHLQNALDKASGSGRILYFPSRVYHTGTLQVKSNTKVYLEAGAVIKGSENRNDYPTDDNRLESDHVNRAKEEYTDNGEWMTFSRLILIDNAENVHISGRGVIDGSGSIIRAQGKPANLIRIRRSKNILIEDVILRDPAAWNTHIQLSDSVVMRNVKIINDFNVANTDGIDPDASRNILVDHCFAYCNDDNIAIKTTNNLGLNQDLENITVKDCVFLTRKSSLKVGTETKAANMSNILFENNDVIVSDRGMVLYCNDGAHFKNIRFVNNRFEYCYIKGTQRPIHFIIKNRYGKGRIENVLIKDCEIYKPFPNGSEIFGLDVQNDIQHIVLDNFIINGVKVNSLQDADIRINEFVKDVTFR